MRTAVALMELASGDNTVYQSVRARRFHEDRDCRAMRAGHLILACMCGDPYCGCQADPKPVIRKLSIALAAIEGLIPCDTCYPGFQELAVQLPAESDFGHRPFWYDGVQICQSCFTENGSRREVVFWPCMSAQILGLVPRQEEQIS